MIDFIQAIILGIVEGITEFLPISSTAHLILTARVLNLSQTDFIKSFEIIIQLGAISAVIFLYWKSLWDWEIMKRLAVAFFPTGVLGLIFYKFIKNYLLGSLSVVLWSLFLGGLFIIMFEEWHKEKNDPQSEISSISYRNCLFLGIFQSIAMIPGVSRSAATIIGGLVLGLKKKTVVEFSFLLAVPTMLAATGLDLIKNFQSFSLSEWHALAIGFVTSLLMAIVGIKFLLSYIQKKSFVPFGIYRIILALIFFGLILK